MGMALRGSSLMVGAEFQTETPPAGFVPTPGDEPLLRGALAAFRAFSASAPSRRVHKCSTGQSRISSNQMALLGCGLLEEMRHHRSASCLLVVYLRAIGSAGMVRDGSGVHLLTTRTFDPQHITFFPIERPRSSKGFVEGLICCARFDFRDGTCVDHFPFGQGSLPVFVGLRMTPKRGYGKWCGWLPIRLGQRAVNCRLLCGVNDTREGIRER